MAGPVQTTHWSHSRLLRSIALAILATVVLVGLVVLIIWLAIRPRGLVYSVEDGKVHGLALHDNHLNASFDFVLKAYNPNHKAALYYDSIQVSVSYDDEKLAFETVEPFFQPRRNVTRLLVKPMAQSAPLTASVSNDLRLEKSSGNIELTIRMKARIRFKVGSWKSWHYTLKVLCAPVEAHLDPSRSFDTSRCDVDI